MVEYSRLTTDVLDEFLRIISFGKGYNFRCAHTTLNASPHNHMSGIDINPVILSHICPTWRHTHVTHVNSKNFSVAF